MNVMYIRISIYIYISVYAHVHMCFVVAGLGHRLPGWQAWALGAVRFRPTETCLAAAFLISAYSWDGPNCVFISGSFALSSVALGMNLPGVECRWF